MDDTLSHCAIACGTTLTDRGITPCDVAAYDFQSPAGDGRATLALQLRDGRRLTPTGAPGQGTATAWAGGPRSDLGTLRAVVADILDARRWQEAEVIVRGLRQDGAVHHATAAELADWRAQATAAGAVIHQDQAPVAADTLPGF